MASGQQRWPPSQEGLAQAERGQVLLGELPPYLLGRAEDSQGAVAGSPIAAQELV